ncbi:DUF429 domain-containing protein [Mesorhizobium xinjiangense]|uniref:DUF429 domain-containing protein n=1 Tax=Mesorhizobium xinjiangense TaxID=2678685 RepID=UPI0012ED69CA|nr:DUF429 domain-containing protein [Mesorhizobium xinjiangense]
MTRPIVPSGRVVVGADGCRGGWVAVIADPAQTMRAAVFTTFAELIGTLPDDAVIAVDMPIGLPEHTLSGGRGPEALVRKFLGERQSSVFSIPSRAAVYAEPGPFDGADEWYAAHRRASAVARQTSDPPRGVSIQAFGIFGKIREVDGLMRARPDLHGRLIESHPEVAFWRLNGGSAMSLPKKIKGRVNPAGMAERKTLLAACGVDQTVMEAPPPRGAGEDDLLDAAAVMLIAARHANGMATPFPDPPGRDAHDIPVAIWA